MAFEMDEPNKVKLNENNMEVLIITPATQVQITISSLRVENTVVNTRSIAKTWVSPVTVLCHSISILFN